MGRFRTLIYQVGFGSIRSEIAPPVALFQLLPIQTGPPLIPSEGPDKIQIGYVHVAKAGHVSAHELRAWMKIMAAIM